MSDFMHINVGGVLFTTYKSTLGSIPGSRLERLNTSDTEYNAVDNCFFFDRNPEIFPYILDYYRTGEMHLPANICVATVRQEMEFWEVSEDAISQCCFSGISQYKDDLDIIQKLKDIFEESDSLEYSEKQLVSSAWCRWMNVVWHFLSKPRSSKYAKIFTICYFLLVFLSILLFVLQTHSSVRYALWDTWTLPHENGTREVVVRDYLLNEFDNNEKMVLFFSTKSVSGLFYTDKLISIFFIVEYLVRFITCPNKFRFFVDIFNLLDLLINITALIAFGIEESREELTNVPLFWTLVACNACTILRVFRMFRLVRYYSGLKVLFLALRASLKELLLLCLSFLIAVILFSSLMYYAEFYRNGSFENIPIAIWWAIVTMTTVGYGDFYPTTLPGYVIGSMCAMCGLLLLSMPIAIIATNFNDVYAKNKIREKQMELKGNNENKPTSNALRRLSSRVTYSRNTSDTSVCSFEQDYVVDKSQILPENDDQFKL